MIGGNLLLQLFLFGVMVGPVFGSSSFTTFVVDKPSNWCSNSDLSSVTVSCLKDCQDECLSDVSCIGVQYKSGSNPSCWIVTANPCKKYSYTYFEKVVKQTQNCGSRNYNLIWILDESGSVGGPNFKSMQDFTIFVSTGLDHNTEKVLNNLKALSFSTVVDEITSTEDNVCDFESSVVDIDYDDGWTNIDDALRKAKTARLVSADFPANELTIVILLTDGEPNRKGANGDSATTSEARNAARQAAQDLIQIENTLLIYGQIANADPTLFNGMGGAIHDMDLGDFDFVAGMQTLLGLVGDVICAPVDCVVGDWGTWGECSEPCGTGSRTRTRTILTPSANNGAPCPPLEETEDCNTQGCPVDCILGEWSDWGQCSEDCGGGTQTSTRTIVTAAANGGEPCGALTKQQPCNEQECPVDCVLSSWGPWSECSTDCGGGTKTRARTITTDPANGGAPCGPLTQTDTCNEHACPVNCEVGPWGSWSECSAECGSGSQERTREITVQPANGGDPCPNLGETRNCNDEPCPIDCVPGPWGPFSPCTEECGGGTKTRTREILTSPANGGTLCPGLEETVACNEDPCPIDCVGDFGPWSGCSVDCGVGTKTRTYSITTPAANGGEQCEHANNYVQEETCVEDPCPINCVMSAWSEWSSCSTSCGPGTQTRDRSVLTPAQYGGTACPTNVFEERDCEIAPCPIDCQVSPWSPWDTCSAECGQGTYSRTRTITITPQYGGAPCPNLEETAPCTLGPCPVDCEVGPFSSWSPCSEECGGGVTIRTREVTQLPAHGGEACPPLIETDTCNDFPCPINCVWGVWSPWSSCSDECGGGEQNRSRSIVINAAYGGDACTGEDEEERSCNPDPCPVDCEVTPFGDWSDCSASCGGGSQTRSRTVVTAAAHGGAACPALEETQSCNDFPCPIDCVVGPWGAYSPCTAECGGGTMTRTRTVQVPPGNGGTECPATEQTIACNLDPCPTDCIVGSWSAWSECSEECDTGLRYRDRPVLQVAANGGAPCPALIEIESCNTDPCPIDCVVSAWCGWSSCSKECGGGIRVRHRTISVEPQFGGQECPELEEEEACNPDPCPVDCVVGDWGSWGDCSYSCGGGIKIRTRPVLTAPAHGGAECPSLTEEMECNTQPCPIDCVVSSWSPFSPCTEECGGGTKTRTRTITTIPAYGGQSCPLLTETVGCNSQPCPIDCQVSAWGSWESCSKDCGGGVQVRTRTIVTDPMYGGQPCPSLTDTQTCNSQPCPVDCVVGNWGAWGLCSAQCGGGQRSRTRPILTQPAYGGATCPETSQTESCNDQPCPVDCIVSAWSAWGSCSKECGGGVQIRTRSVDTPPANGGTACPPTEETKPCNTQPCPIDCVLGPWSAWSSCDLLCGGGTRSRTRPVLTAPQFGGEECGETEESEPCNDFPCPIDCVVSPWSEWDQCTASCGGGTQQRTRTVLVQPAFGGLTCPSQTETRQCNEQPCPIDCVWGPWSTWSDCSVSCGGGSRTRERSVQTPSQHGGVPCSGPSTETASCHEQPCPIDCVVSPWSAFQECSASCGGGTKTRTRMILIQPQYGGQSCPCLSETVDCNTQECPVDCVLEEWSEWSDCTADCGGGTQTRSRDVISPALYGGHCPYTGPYPQIETRSCGNSPCPIDCEVGPWEDWDDCTALCGGGTRTRIRPILQQPMYGGQACPLTSETQSCNDVPCPVNCVVGQWGEWGACSAECGGGTQVRTRTVTTPPLNGGQSCPATEEQRPCNNEPCPVDCKVSDWGPWCGCSAECGGGTRSRTRTVTVPPANGGAGCPVLEEEEACNTQECPINCEVTVWGEWSSCSASCGGGVQTRSRSVSIPPAHGGTSCPALEQEQVCNTDPCPIDCVVGPWLEWSSCNVACGGGSKTRSRDIVTPPQHGGAACPPTSEEMECNTHECPINCEVGPWTEWGQCTEICGGGSQQRTREITTQPQHGGSACPPLTQTQTCNDFPCPIDCVVGPWTQWGQCSEECGGGVQSRTRPVLTPSGYGGTECPETTETRNCNGQPCPVDCVVSSWGPWTQCSAPCGGGSRTRERTVLVEQVCTGAPCPPLVEREDCNMQPCPVDCQVGEWSEWGECSAECGTGTQVRTRDVVAPPLNGGESCPSTVEERECNTNPCPVDCVLGSWGEWSSCSEACDGGVKTRTQNIVVPSANGGMECPPTGLASELKIMLSGNYLHFCEIKVFADSAMEIPIELTDPEQSSLWGNTFTPDLALDGNTNQNWAGNSCVHTESGTNEYWKATIVDDGLPVKKIVLYNRMDCCKDRIVGAQVLLDGVVVYTIDDIQDVYEIDLETIMETMTCNEQECPIHCEVSEWSEWSECSEECGCGVQTRQRDIVTEPMFGGNECPPLFDAKVCNEQPCAVDCEVGPWSEWDTCDQECGGGSQSRFRSVVVEPSNGGAECPSLVDIQTCNDTPCPIDCVLGPWSEWSSCSEACGGGTQTRTRPVLVQPDFGGLACPNDLEEERVCNDVSCPIDCEVGPWSEWDECSKVCGGGIKTRTREVTVEPDFGGAECPPLEEEAPCNEEECSCTARVVFGIDYTYDNKGRTFRQKEFATAQAREVLINLGDSIHPDKAHIGMARLLTDSVDEVVPLGSDVSMDSNALIGYTHALVSIPNSVASKKTDFVGFFEDQVPKVTAEAPEHESFLVLYSDFHPESTGRKFMKNLYQSLDNAINVPNKPTVLCYRPNTWSNYQKLEDKYCDVRWTQSEAHNKLRYRIGAEIARHICPPSQEEQAALTNPCTTVVNKKACKQVRRASDGGEPEGSNSYNFCSWIKRSRSCVVRPKYEPLYTEESNTADDPVDENPCNMLGSKKKCKKKKSKVGGKKMKICVWDDDTSLCDLKAEYSGIF